MSRRLVRLGEILELERMPANIDPDATYTQIGIRSFGNGIFHREPCLGWDLGKLRYFKIFAGRLIVSNIMAWEGAVALSAEKDAKCIGSNRFLSYKVIGEADLSYLNHYFRSAVGRALIRGASTGTVTRNQTLSTKDFENLVIPLPDLKEQTRVAVKLDGMLERLNRLGSLRSHADILRRQHLNVRLSLVDNFVSLEEILIPSSDFTAVEPSESYRVAGIYNHGRGLFERQAIQGHETKYPRLNRLHEGQFVYSKLFGWEGSLATVPSEFEGVHVSHEFPTFNINEEIADPQYVAHLAKWEGLHVLLRDQGTGMGSRRQRVNVDRLLATKVPLPSRNQQAKLAVDLTKVSHSGELSKFQVSTVGTLHSALLDAAFNDRL